MLSSFFSKSKPINYIVVALYMAILFCIAFYKKGFTLENSHILITIGSMLLYILPMRMLSAEVQRNDLTQKGTFTILLYAVITGMLPYSLINFDILLSSIFVQLAAQNIVYLKNEKHVNLKILNASICIGLASLVCFWSIGFMGLVFFGILYFDPKNYKNWIIPVIGLTSVYVLANCFTLLFYDTFFSFSGYIEPVSFSFDAYLIKDRLFSVVVCAILIVFFFSVYLVKFGKKTASTKPVLNVIIAYFIFAIAVGLIAPEKNTSELFFISTPLAIIGTTYLEMQYNQFAKEINIWIFILIPFTLVFF
ncbi:DUF6427 family protein [Aquimarina pacifica]|uniref:DUF6427 family protein n=1 Tax=Aquimarina pacifica TaxID=1296415 RepID=UPI0004B7D4B3|nr:DUF6427 family protein [Aquimarina pacifica]